MANNALGVRTASETMRTLAFGAVGAAFTAIGTPITNASRMLKIDNFTDQTLNFSDDGVNTKFQLTTMTSLFLNITTNRSDVGGVYCYAAHTQFWVLAPGSAPGSGQVNVSTWYAYNPDN